MSDRSASGPSSGDEPITWSIHAAEQGDGEVGQDSHRDDEGGSSSSNTSDEDRPSRRDRQRGRDEERALDDDYALRLAHAMTHNPADALLPSPPRSPPRAVPNRYEPFSGRTVATGDATASNNTDDAQHSVRIVTINDVKNRTCWICSDGDSDETEQNTGRRRWLHPCKCSLMAHEDCLLTWIRSRRGPDPKKPILCPQCAQPYTILERKPALLRLFESCNKVVHDAVPLAAAGVMGGSVLVAATAYGCAAIRLWMGKEAAARALGGRWPWHYYVDIPMIPFALLVSRLRLLDYVLAWLPTLAAFPILHFPIVTLAPGRQWGARRPWDQPDIRRFSMLSTHRPWPPGPALTLLLVPWVRAVYISLKLHVTRRVLAPFSRKVRPGNTGNSARERSRRFIIIGDEAPFETLDDEGGINVDQNGLPRDLPPGAEAIENDRTVYVTPQSLARVCLGALSGPIIANLMGKVLAKLARYNTFLRRFLGMEGFTPPSIRPTRPTGGVRPSSSKSAPSSSKTPLANLFSTGSLYPDVDAGSSNAEIVPRTAVYETADGLSWYQPTSLYDDLDPVWFRNAIGAGLFILMKDVAQLSYRYLRLEHAKEGSKRTKIVDRPFVGGIIDQLELRDPAVR